MGGLGLRCRDLWLALAAFSCTALFFTAMLVEKPVTKLRDEPVTQDVKLPKVAMMYLTRGPMPTALVWREWYDLAGRLEPTPGANLEAFMPRARSSQSGTIDPGFWPSDRGDDSDADRGDVVSQGGQRGGLELVQHGESSEGDRWQDKEAGGAAASWDGDAERHVSERGTVIEQVAAKGFVPTRRTAISITSRSGHEAVAAQVDAHHVAAEAGAGNGGMAADDGGGLEGGWGDGGEGGGAQQAAGVGGGGGRRDMGTTQQQQAQPAACSDLAAVRTGDIIARQSLFSVYVHVAMGFWYCEGDLFHGYELRESERVEVHWGQHTMVEAERALFAAALDDPLNQRFMMLSESCLPLYPPQVVWLQLMWEQQSRVNACKGERDWDKRGEDRWSDNMRTDVLDRDHWRKSSQWAAFVRRHAELVAADEHVHEAFKMQCYTYYPGLEDVPDWLNETDLENRHCISDEHYIPTLLAVHGRDDETDCLGAATHTEWRLNSWSPKLYRPMQVTYYLLRKLRRAWYSAIPCAAREAMDSANSLFRAKGAPASIQVVRNASVVGRTPPAGADYDKYLPVQIYSEYQPLDHACSLFARKFDGRCSEPILKLAADCDYGLGFSTTCADNVLPIVPEDARVTAFQKQMLEHLHTVSQAAKRAALAEAAALHLGPGDPGAHASHGGPGSDDDSTEHIDYWAEHGERHGIPLPPELLRPNTPDAEQQGQEQQQEQLNIQEFLPEQWPPEE